MTSRLVRSHTMAIVPRSVLRGSSCRQWGRLHRCRRRLGAHNFSSLGRADILCIPALKKEGRTSGGLKKGMTSGDLSIQNGTIVM